MDLLLIKFKTTNSKRNSTQCWLVLFYSISTSVGYLNPNRVYRYLFNIYDFSTNNLLVTLVETSQSSVVCTL